ncbi:MAG: SUMF1/EgtB/PvdO family nonheme iron enzyme [Puniceicoccales bacterium]
MSDDLPPPATPTLPGRAYEVLTPGEKFGDYQVLRCVSYDLLGSLYRVRKPRAKNEQTVFVMPPIIAPTPEFKQRFNEIAPKLCGLEHPNVFAFGEASLVKDRFTFLGGPFEGMNLADYLQDYVDQQLKERKPHGDEPQELVSDLPMGLPAEEVRSIISQVLEGLDFLYQNKIQHLNLNPTNILRAKGGQISVAGFGLFNLIGQERFEEVVSAGIPPIALGGRAIRINTVDILSPEARQGKASDARSDVYALGITTYWLLTGRKPGANYQRPSEIVEGLDEKWDIFIANCLDREPERRYQSVTKAKADFTQFHAIKPIRTSAPRNSIGTTDTATIFRHIDFIPVPRQVKERGEKTARIFRLAVIGLVLIIAASLFFSTMKLMLGDSYTEGKVAIRTPEGKTPRLVFDLEPQTSLVTIPGTDVRFIVKDGQLNLNILPGSYRFEFSAPGYQKTSRLLQVESSPMRENISLAPSWAKTTFTSLPDTKLTATSAKGDVVELGTTDETGKLVVTEKISAGEYEISADKEGYAITDSGPFTLSAKEENFVEVPVDAVLGVLRVRSEPRGAAIFFRDQQIGETNETLKDLPVDEEFTITLKKPGYRDSTLAVRVASDTRTILDFGELAPLAGEVDLSIELGSQPISPAEIERLTIKVEATSPFLDKQEITYTGAQLGESLIVPQINEGDVTLTVSHPNYRDQTRSFTMGNKVRVNVAFDLEALPGIVSIEPEPAGQDWSFRFNGRAVRLPELKAPLPVGKTSTLSISNPNYFTQSKSFQPSANERITWAPVMKKVPSPSKGTNYETPFLDMPLIWIAPGSFKLGSPPNEASRLPEEGPQTSVRISQGFWIAAHEVTQKQYKMVMGNNPAEHQGETKPVESVSWSEARAFCRKLTEQESAAGRIPAGFEYRLPTEAEWEYAARAGSSTPFNWGNTADWSKGNFRGNYPRDFDSSHLDAPTHYGTQPVGSYQPNAWGLYDMHGNVREWCLDSYNARLPGGDQTDWIRREGSSRRAIRGGGWEDFAIHARSAYRSEGMSESARSASAGIRVVLGPKVEI